MAKKKGNEGWLIIGLIVAGLGLYYLQTGLGNQNDSALLPKRIEDRIDDLIAALNGRFGKRWVDLGLGVLTYNLQNVLPAALVILIGVVVKVENISKGRLMTGNEKRQLAVEMADGL